MASDITRFLWAVLPSIFCAIVMVYFNRKINARDKRIESRAELRKQESLLSLKMAFANGKLGYAAAMAVKRGQANGEIEDAIDSYEEAVSEYNKFVNELHYETLEKGQL